VGVSFSTFREALIGKPITHVWRGYGSAIFIEFGSLTQRTRRDGSPGQPSGEITLMIEWSWRVEKARSIMGGSCSSERRWPAIFKKLLGSVVTDVELVGVLSEVSLTLSNGMRVLSFMTTEGQPSWAIMTRKSELGTLSVKRGRLHVEAEEY
jgi:hypothetical protein